MIRTEKGKKLTGGKEVELKIKAISLFITQQMAWQNEYFLSNSQNLLLLGSIVCFIMNGGMELK